MNINSVLDKIIKVLLISIISIMLIIGLLFVTPISVHADSAPSLLNVTSGTPDTYTITTNGLFCGSNSYGSIYAISGVSDTYVGKSSTNTTLFVASPNYLGNSVWYSNPRYSNAVYPFNSPTYDSNSQLYWSSFSASFTSSDLASFSNYSEFLSAVQNVINTPAGEFYTLPQVSGSTEIDYVTIASTGANIYAEGNTYSYLGQYETALSPTSQFCYVRTGIDAYTPVVFSSVPLTVYNAFINGQTYSYFVLSEYDTGKYCYTVPTYATIDEVEPCVPFESLSDAKAAFTGATSSGSGSASGVVSAGAFSYSVPAGNVLYVRVRPGSIASVTADMPVISSTSSPYWLESQINTMWASGVPSLPNSGTVFPLSNMTRINFGLDPSVSPDGYGRSYSAWASHAPFNGGWFVVYNPAYTKTILPGRTDLMSVNPTVTVNCQFALEYYLYPLSESLTVDGGTSTNSTGYTDSWSGVYDPDTDKFDDTSTITDDTPSPGGEQADTVSQNNMGIGDYVHEINNVLNNFVESISQLLSAPIAHIQKLITYASSFMAAISQFFSWLPEPVFTMIVAALGVAVCIGVIKLLF